MSFGKEFIDHCNARDENLSNEFVNAIGSQFFDLHGIDFFAGMSIQSLLETEERIIGLEFFLSRNDPNEISNQKEVDRLKRHYGELRGNIEDKLREQFTELYNSMKLEHNECARSNLENNNGRLFSYVLPKFNKDGSHEPWGERDVPWSNYL